MGEDKTKICRLCLNVQTGAFEILDQVRQEMLETLPLQLDMNLSDDPIICEDCSNCLQSSFDFKMGCLTNNDYLKTFITENGSKPIILEEVILKSKPTTVCKDELRACRFCLKYFEKSLLTVLSKKGGDMFRKDMLEKCSPDMDLTITNDPLLCSSCLESLQSQFSFMSRCSESEGKIKHFLSLNNRSGNKKISLFEVFEFISTVKDETVVDVPECIVKLEMEIDDVFGEESFNSAAKKEETFEQVDCKEFLEKVEQNIKSDSDKEECPAPKMTVTAAGMFACSLCQHQTNRRDSLEKHFLIHRPKAEVATVGCGECDFRTKWKGDLKKHMLRHKAAGEVEMFECGQCEYKSKYKNHLRRHVKTHMGKEKPEVYECEHCPARTRNRPYFWRHNRAKHNREVAAAALACDQCAYSSKSSRNLAVHAAAAHGAARPKAGGRFACDVCGYRTDKVSHFKEHALSHKPSGEVEMYKCETCSFQTKYKNSIKKHKLTHLPHKKKLKVPTRNQFIKN